MSEVGFIGLGAMGWPMARRLVEAGHHLTVRDAAAQRSADFARETGAVAATSSGEVAARSDIIITMLPTSHQVRDVLDGADGVLAHHRPNAMIIEMSSGAPALTRLIGAQVAAAGCRIIDAPVSGGVPRARTGELAIMVGGAEADIEAMKPLLATMGSTILPTGPLGSAHAMKALNNLVSATTLLATIEALSIGQTAGLDPARMVDILNVSTGMSNSSLKKMHQFVLSGRYESGFGLDLMVKDLATAMDIAGDGRVPAPLSALARETWRQAQAFLGPGQDHTALARLVESLTSVRLRPEQD